MPDGRTAAAAFTEGSVVRHLVRLGSYMAVGSISINLAQLSEAVYLGVIGTEALAALGFAFPVTITLFAFAGGIGTGASSVIARLMGAGGREDAARLVTHAQLLVLLIGIMLGSIGMRFSADIVSILGAKDVVHEMAVSYLEIYMAGFPLFMLSMVGSTLLRATGNAASPGLIMTAGSLLQVALGPIFIFGWLGLPELGIAGAAWAYLTARGLSVLLYSVLLIRVRMIRFSLRDVLKSWGAILHVGGPAIASGLVQPVSMLIITRLLASHGHEVVAGYNVASRVETMAHMILWSVSSSVEPFVGQNWGGKRFERAKEALRLCYGFCVGWGLLMFMILVSAGDYFVSLIDDDATVVGVAGSYFLFIPVTIGFMGIMQVASSCFNAIGKPAPAFAISLFRTLVVYIPLAVLGDMVWGYVGIFVATATTNVVMGTVALLWNNATVNRAIGLQAPGARLAAGG